MVISHDVVVAAERFDKIDILRSGEADHLYLCALGMQEMCETKRGLAGGRGQDHALRVVESVLRQIIIDQKGQHEQRPQQRLLVALPAGKGRVAADHVHKRYRPAPRLADVLPRRARSAY